MIDAINTKFNEHVEFTTFSAAFLMTPKGIQFMRTIERDSPFSGFFYETARIGIESLAIAFRLPVSEVREHFKFMIFDGAPPIFMDPLQFWKNYSRFLPLFPPCTSLELNLRLRGIFSPESGCTSSSNFVELGLRMLSFPASEVGCERVFCNLRNLIGDSRKNLSSDTITHLMRIRMNSIFQGGKFILVNDANQSFENLINSD
jgi:hypothetical protein